MQIKKIIVQLLSFIIFKFYEDKYLNFLENIMSMWNKTNLIS